MSLDTLLDKVQKIVNAYEDPSKRKKREQEEAELDEFGRLKKQIARDIKETRKVTHICKLNISKSKKETNY